MSALGHPLWWTALGVLLVNDHVLKGAALLPGAVTGKLSDFAGLLVAPVLLAALVRARGRGAILACFAATGSAFAAIKLSPATAGAAESVMAFVSWRVWSDPTDLLALPMLLVGWHFFVEAPAPSFARDSSPMLSRAALVLGGIGCIATSQVAPPAPWDPHNVAPQFGQLEILYDAPGGDPSSSEIVRVRQLRAGVTVDCDRLMAAPFETVTASLLAPANRFALAPNALIDSASGAESSSSGRCRLAVIDHETAGTITVAYSTSSAGSRASLVRGADGSLSWSLSSGTMLSGAPSSPPTSDACGGATSGLPVTWTSMSGSYFQWKSAETQPDGCTLVTLGYNLTGLDDERWFVCGVDASALPFIADETVQVSTSAAAFEVHSIDGRASVVFSRGAGTDMHFEPVADCLVSDACGERSEVLVPRMNASEWLMLPDAGTAVAAFERGSFGSTTRERRYVLRATNWLSADAACVDGAAQSGMDIELLTVSEATR